VIVKHRVGRRVSAAMIPITNSTTGFYTKRRFFTSRNPRWIDIFERRGMVITFFKRTLTSSSRIIHIRCKSGNNSRRFIRNAGDDYSFQGLSAVYVAGALRNRWKSTVQGTHEKSRAFKPINSGCLQITNTFHDVSIRSV